MNDATPTSQITNEEIRDALIAAWPSPLVSRTEVERFSGGILKRGTLANLDALGRGPRRVSIAGRTAYYRDDLISWMLNRRRGASSRKAA